MNSSIAMKIDIMGRINKINIKRNEYLLPLFEAVVNSFQSLEDSSSNKKWIKITLERNDEQFSLEKKEYDEYPFCNYIIEDNGIGFNDKNFDSFLTSDSTYKLSKGGKGIGRFIWLKAFKNIIHHCLDYFLNNDDINSCIEVIYYDKLESDARKRNKILFDKLFNPQI